MIWLRHRHILIFKCITLSVTKKKQVLILKFVSFYQFHIIISSLESVCLLFAAILLLITRLGGLFYYAITMCNNLIFICYHLHPNTSLHLLIFYSILSSITQLYIQLFVSNKCLFIYVYFFILILFVLSVCVIVVSVKWELMTLISCMRKHTWQ